jgi:hypothetical protein
MGWSTKGAFFRKEGGERRTCSEDGRGFSPCATSLRSSGAVIKCFASEVLYLSNWPASRGDIGIFL